MYGHAGLSSLERIPLVPTLEPLLHNAPFHRQEQGETGRDPKAHGEAKSPPPGGILVVATVSGLSGAVMGLLFGGYLTASLAILIGSTLGVAVGVWARGLGS